jgi:hypothetical protein
VLTAADASPLLSGGGTPFVIRTKTRGVLEYDGTGSDQLVQIWGTSGHIGPVVYSNGVSANAINVFTLDIPDIGDFLELKLTGGLVASEASLATLQDAAWHLAELEIEYDGVENRGGGTALGWTCVALRSRSFERCATVSLSHSSVAHLAHSRLRCVRRYNDWLVGYSGFAHAAVFAAADGVDVTVPGLTAVSISSSNAASATAKAGDTLLLSMQADEPILTPTVTINGHDVTVTAPHQSTQVSPFQAMPGCSGGYEMILDLALCNAAKAVLRPTFTGVNDGGFGGEWSNGCFFNGNAVYFHAVGADHSGYDGYGGFSATHQTLCVLKTGTPSLYTSSTGAYNWVDITGAGTKIDNSEFTSGSYDGKLTHTSGHLS